MKRFRTCAVAPILVLMATPLVACATAATEPTPLPKLPAATSESEPAEKGKLEMHQITSQALANNPIYKGKEAIDHAVLTAATKS